MFFSRQNAKKITLKTEQELRKEFGKRVEAFTFDQVNGYRITTFTICVTKGFKYKSRFLRLSTHLEHVI